MMAQNEGVLLAPIVKKMNYKEGRGGDNLTKEREFSRRLLKISVLAYVFNVK